MSQRQRFRTCHTIVLCLVAGTWLLPGPTRAEAPLARDDFEHDLSKWQTVGHQGNVRIIPEAGAEADNHVLELVPQRGEFVHTLLRGSEGWTNVRIEGRVLFPTSGDGYLGLIYNHRRRGSRTDFGCIYIKSNGSYIRVSPHRDGNPSWRLYEELKAPLEGQRKIVPNRWYRFRLDVVGREARFAFGDLARPLVRFDGIEMDRGAIGLEARPGRGDPVWVDDIVVRRLRTIPTTDPDPGAKPMSPELLTRWEAFDPFALPSDTIETGGGASLPRSVVADARGMLITGRITDFASGDRYLAYLRTTLDGGEEGALRDLVFSSANQIDAWLDGRHLATIEPQDFAWTDFLSTPEHVAARLSVTLNPGPNTLLLRVDGDRFAGGGFLAAVAPTTEPGSSGARPGDSAGAESDRTTATPTRPTPTPRDGPHPVTTPGVKVLMPLPTAEQEEVEMMPTADVPPGLRGLIDLAVADLADRLTIDVDQIEVVEVRTVVWPDGSLGCPEPDVAYIQVQREGLLIRLRARRRVYQYHSGGGRPPFLCEHPIVPEDIPPSPGLSLE